MKKETADELEALGSSLQHLSRKMPFSVPEGYFGQMTAEVESATCGVIGSMPKGAKSQQPFSMPEGYFEQMTADVMSKTVGAEKNRTIPFVYLRWVAAAVLVIAVGVGMSGLFNGVNVSTAGSLASVSDKDIRTYLSEDMPTVDIDKIADNSYLDGIDTKEIESYLDENGWDDDVLTENIN